MLSHLALALFAAHVHAANPNSYGIGIFDSSLPGGANCFSSSNPLGGVTADIAQCDPGNAVAGGAVGLVSFDSAGRWGAYASTSNASLLRLGAGGADRLRVRDTSVDALVNVNMAGTIGVYNKIINMADGTIAAGGRDAINGGQIFNISDSLRAAFGAGVTVDGAGKLTAPSFALTQANAINGTSGPATDVGTALTKVDDALGRLSSAAGLVKQAAAGQKLTVGAATDGADVDFTGTAGTRTLSGLANGAVSAASTQAINGSQLHGTATSVATALGGGSTVDANGNVTGTTFATTSANAINGSTASPTSVGAAVTELDNALGDLDERTTQNEGDIVILGEAMTELGDAIDNGTIGLVQQDQTSRAITVAKGLDGTLVDLNGTQGARSITGVKAGAISGSSLEAINGSQLHASNTAVAAALGGGSTLDANGNVTVPSYATTNASAINGSTTSPTNVGAAVTELDNAIGDLDERTTDIEGDITNLGDDITRLGDDINNGVIGLTKHDATTGVTTIAKDLGGTVVNVSGTEGVRTVTGVKAGEVSAASADAINGSQLHSVASSTVNALGGGAAVNADGSITGPIYTVGGTSHSNVGSALTNLDGRVNQNTTDISNLTNNINNGSVGLVKQDAASREITVASHLDGTRVNVAGSAGNRQVTGVAAGAVTTSSTDAVNGSQLGGLAASTAGALGGGSTVNTDGSITGPSYTVGGQTVNNVGDALSNVDGRVTQNTTDITNLQNNMNNGSLGLVKQDATTKQVTVAAATGGTEVNVAGTEGPRRLTGVERGVGNKDAVNVEQFKEAINGSYAYTDARINDAWSEVNYKLDEYNRQSNRGIAAASALINVTPYVPGRVALNAGIATYRGETALGVGLSRWSEDGKLNVNGGISAAHGDKPVVRVGVGIVF